MIQPKNYFKALMPVFNTKRTKEIFRVNPTVDPVREEAKEVKIDVYDYNAEEVQHLEFNSVKKCAKFKDNGKVTWINIDGLRKVDVEAICNAFGIHPLLIEDILSIGQRPKMDELDNVLFALLNMLYFNEESAAVEQEQVSIILGKDYVLSFQEEACRDVFNPIREKINAAGSKIRTSGADYLCYSLIDIIVDNYYNVLELLGEHIETLEEDIIRYGNIRSLSHINNLRKELIILKRNINPVREVVNGFMRTESDLLQDKVLRYFKDVYDHIVQANDLVENYRDMMMSLQDLYLNKVNLRMNEVMKVMAIVTCLLAPATVIGGIFGMNFESIPYLHNQYGFWIAVSLMLVFPIWMIFVFKRRGWFKN
jgi:magnesium transporter